MAQHIPSIILDALKETGLNYAIENGGKHYKIKLEGRLTGILPFGRGSSDPRSCLNIRSQIRRTASELKNRNLISV